MGPSPPTATRQARRGLVSHGGSNFGFRCTMVAHRSKGYGLVMMTNGDSGDAVMPELQAQIEQAYTWDSLDAPCHGRMGRPACG